jgi:uncharacterized protein YbbC (DUF1343 family)/CubicO group peptidase (beta-lactamase class C family)
VAEDLLAALQRAVAEAEAPGAAAYVGSINDTFLNSTSGLRQLTPSRQPAQNDTLYDLASLTKVIATTSAILSLRDEGELQLDQRVSEIVPVPAFSAFTVRHLLTHTSGLPPTRPWYKEVTTVNEMLQRAAQEDLAWTPGVYRRYSDLGFIILGKVVELTAQDTLDAFCHDRFWKPLGMQRTMFNPPEALRSNAAATEDCNWRGRVMLGEVHDENAYAIGGVAGHAGLFSTITDLAVFCRALLQGKVLKESTVQEMARPQVATYPWQGLGWKRDPWHEGSEGFLPVRNCIGHTGWTGTCLWIDLDRDIFGILLSNTCHPSRNHRDNRTLRQTFFTPVAARVYPNQTNTHTGLDRVLWDTYDGVKGQIIGLLTHQAAQDSIGRPILTALQASPQVRITRLFSPEHGLEGTAEAGEKVGAQHAPVPVVSLYGDKKRPARADLAGIDRFVIDLQDVGSRYYTYPATMKECLHACADAGVPVLVLDRPNPVGGRILEGPIAVSGESIVCWGKVPVRHGMTMGELAEFFRKTEPGLRKLQLAIHILDAWKPDFFFDQLQLPWKAPSPNIPNPETALVYVGMCLFEGTNLNEGRGTITPFKLVGAPWLDAGGVLRQLPPEATAGFTIDPMVYTPKAIPGKASAPRFQDNACRGIRMDVSNAVAVRPFTLAVSLLCAIRNQHPDRLEFTAFFDTLAGGPWLRQQIEAGVAPLDIIAMIAPALATFDAQRPKFYTQGLG